MQLLRWTKIWSSSHACQYSQLPFATPQFDSTELSSQAMVYTGLHRLTESGQVFRNNDRNILAKHRATNNINRNVQQQSIENDLI